MARILLVDDEPSILMTLSYLLRSSNYEVTTALGGHVAKQTLAHSEFDLMISDIRMSPVNGMQLLEYARETRPDMAVIMLTAYGQIETAILAQQQGAFDYIKKPFDPDDLLAKVKQALDCRQYNAPPGI